MKAMILLELSTYFLDLIHIGLEKINVFQKAVPSLHTSLN
jgi:hypothetical protein